MSTFRSILSSMAIFVTGTLAPWPAGSVLTRTRESSRLNIVVATPSKHCGFWTLLQSRVTIGGYPGGIEFRIARYSEGVVP